MAAAAVFGLVVAAAPLRSSIAAHVTAPGAPRPPPGPHGFDIVASVQHVVRQKHAHRGWELMRYVRSRRDVNVEKSQTERKLSKAKVQAVVMTGRSMVVIAGGRRRCRSLRSLHAKCRCRMPLSPVAPV
jgi:hypothetical protein